MQIAFHIGAHCTDDDKLLKCLLKNKGKLASDGVIIPGPGRYRKLVRETVASLNNQPASEETQEALLDAIIDEDSAGRLILTNENFICNIPRIFEHQNLYGAAAEKVVGLCQLFPSAEVELFLAVRNPATFLPALAARADDRTHEQLLHNTNPTTLLWSELAHRIRMAAPNAALTIWANEDTPLIWSELLHELAGIEPHDALNGEFDLLEEIMSKEGIRRFRSYMASHPPQTEIQKRRVIAAFLDKFALEDEIEVELDLPGWTDEYVNALTELYEEDLFTIQRMPGVNFISP